MAIDIQKEDREVRAKPQQERPYATVKQISEYMGVCSHTIIAWIKAGKLDGEQIGRSYKIPLAAFEALKQKFPQPENAQSE